MLDGDTVVFMTGRDTVKGRTLRRTGQAVLTVDDAAPPYSFVSITGRVELSEDLEAMLPWSIASPSATWARSKARSSAGATRSTGELLVRLSPDNIVALADLAD